MRERMAQVGGHLNIRSWPGEGTEIAATIPFEQQKTS
jgi:signal transduction histidine kinase